MQNLIKIYDVVEELWAFSLTANIWTDGRMDSHSDYSADPRVVQYATRWLSKWMGRYTSTLAEKFRKRPRFSHRQFMDADEWSDTYVDL